MPDSPNPALSAEELLLQASELSRKAAQALADEREEADRIMAERLLGQSQVPKRFAAASLSGGRPEQAAAYAQAKVFVLDFAGRLQTGACMVLFGDVGVGKTHLACAIANELRKRHRSVLYCTALETVMRVKASWKTGDGLTEFDVYKRFGEPDLLIIDEIGVQAGSDFERMVLTGIADIRSRNCLPMVIVTNLDLPDVHGLLGERMFDRLVGFDAAIVEMRGASLRSAKLRVA